MAANGPILGVTRRAVNNSCGASSIVSRLRMHAGKLNQIASHAVPLTIRATLFYSEFHDKTCRLRYANYLIADITPAVFSNHRFSSAPVSDP